MQNLWREEEHLEGGAGQMVTGVLGGAFLLELSLGLTFSKLSNKEANP